MPIIPDPDESPRLTLEDIRLAAEIFGELSDRHDQEELPGGDEPFSVEPVDDDELERLVRHFEAEEQYDLDSEPDYDELANRYEEQQLAELGLLPLGRGTFGHLA